MTEQQTPDREKKIAEIREALERIDRGDLFEIAAAHEKSGEWLRFLLDELDKRDEENRKLREERDAVAEGYRQQVELAGELMTKLVSAQQERDMYKSSSEVFYERLKIRDELLEQLCAQIKYYFGGDGGLAKLQDGVNKLLQERQRLIDGLLTIKNIASEDGVHWKLDRCYTTARDILKEIGVTGEC